MKPARAGPYPVAVTVEWFKDEVREALKKYERHVVCLEKTPDQVRVSLESLLRKAIKAYQERAPGLRHGIALDRHLTIILSQAEGDRPYCGIYFNLHSPYLKQSGKTAAPTGV